MKFLSRSPLVHGLFIGLMSVFYCRTFSQQLLDAVSFDTLFPENWYTKVLKNCMHIWSELDVYDALDFNEQERILDASIGRVVYCAQQFDQQKQHTQSASNIAYLIRGLEEIESKCVHYRAQLHQEKHHLLRGLIAEFKHKLVKLLQSDDTAISTGQE